MNLDTIFQLSYSRTAELKNSIYSIDVAILLYLRKKIGETEFGIGTLPLWAVMLKFQELLDESFDTEHTSARTSRNGNLDLNPALQRLIILLRWCYCEFHTWFLYFT